jgi:hypothetical protein
LTGLLLASEKKIFLLICIVTREFKSPSPEGSIIAIRRAIKQEKETGSVVWSYGAEFV